ncbi:SusC/RagA family TonB-linked outer membrane protein [Spirosoma fluviale]|uniref:TonB-linked outer membrane protein, SusC/RagA family n=1 Tax=Spirosoma fluviale TaxID=1597977 RepID=A0A286GU46_9BACT|nr:SusC/RagA family TonB-linked outer membrane protein [Spirosoma fluviale]SOD98706.1 TonB-linked outer membrane protein, SusC/RagA family [Spirosoma fluviale]
MKKALTGSWFLLLLFYMPVLAQETAITGRVTSSDDGSALPGVSVVVKGTTRGTTTDANGTYQINTGATTTLTFSFVGFKPQDVAVGNRATVNVVLAADASTLNEVVVTGFGIRRNEREIGTSVTKINNTLINQAAPVNLANGLTGKVAGLQINAVSNGVGTNPRITIRGNRSFLGNNQALLVVDGALTDVSFLSAINPNDIESSSILKGPSAAALYGSDAANGVLVITTRRGTTNNKPQISYTNNTQLESVSYMPDLQRLYGSNGGEGAPFLDANGQRLYVPYENQQFGPLYNGSLQPLGYGVQIINPDGSIRIDTLKVPYSSTGKDPRRAFFSTGVTQQHDLAYRVGDAENYFGLSVQRVDQKGIVPNDKYSRTNFTVNGGRTIDRFTANAKMQFTYENTDQENGDFGQGRPLYWNLLNQPAHAPLNDPRIKDINSPYGDVNGYFNAYYPNPWWQVTGDNSRAVTNKYSIQGTADIGYKFTDWLNVTYRVSGQVSNTQFKSHLAAVSFSSYALGDPWGAGNIASSLKQVNGNVSDYSRTTSRVTGDLLITVAPTFGDFTTKLILGQQARVDNSRYISTTATSLVVPGTYNIANRLGNVLASENSFQSRLLGYFYDFTAGFRNFAFINATGRYDNTSLLAPGNRSYFYPGVNASVILTEAIPALKGSNALTYLKLRGGIARAGNISVGPYQLQNVFNPGAGFPYGSQPGFSLSTQQNDPNLKPEFTTNKEVGVEFGLFDRVNAEIVYYTMETINQTVPIQVSRATGYGSALINTGSMLNNGLEVELKTLRPIVNTGGFTWNINTNFTYLNNTVTSVYPGLDRINITQANGAQSSNVFAAVNYTYPALFGTDIARVQNTDANAAYYDPTGQFVGQAVINPATGYPILDANFKYLGNTQPKYRFGLNNTFAFKGLTLNALVEYRGGNVIYNQLGNALEFTGAGIRTTYNGRQNFIFPNSVLATTNPDGTTAYAPNTSVSTRDGNLEFWTNSGYHNAVSSYVTSAAFWKLREVALSYNFPTQLFSNIKFIRSLTLGLTGRNLLMLRPKTNVFTDPEFSLDNSNAQGVTNEYQTPPTRQYGFRLSVGF